MDFKRQDKKMRRTLIGIDSADNLRYSMVVAGPEDAVLVCFEKIAACFKSEGVHKIHFRKIDKRIRDKLSRRVADIILSATTVSFTVFEHSKPSGCPYREYFLRYVPEQIAAYLESFDNKNRLIQIDVHNDYMVAGVYDSMKRFSEELLRMLSRKMSPDFKGIKMLSDGRVGIISTKILTKRGNYIKLRSLLASQDNSTAVNLADITLGFFRCYLPLIQKKIHYKKI